VRLLPEERKQLQALLSKGKASARTLMHARILLKTDEGVDGPRLTDDEIAEAVEVNRSTGGACEHSVRRRRGQGGTASASLALGTSAQAGRCPGTTPGGGGVQSGTERSCALVAASAGRQAGGTGDCGRYLVRNGAADA